MSELASPPTREVARHFTDHVDTQQHTQTLTYITDGTQFDALMASLAQAEKYT